jgi:hypothetical protein
MPPPYIDRALDGYTPEAPEDQLFVIDIMFMFIFMFIPIPYCGGAIIRAAGIAPPYPENPLATDPRSHSSPAATAAC